MKYSFMWLLLYFMGFITATIAMYFFINGAVPVSYILGSITGILIVFLTLNAHRNSVIKLIGIILATITVPVILERIIALISSLLSFDVPAWSIITTYFIGCIIAFYLLTHFESKHISEFFSKSHSIDERSFYYLILSGFAAFLFLFFIIIGILLQPWLALDDLRLWISILLVSVIFWVVTAIVLETKK